MTTLQFTMPSNPGCAPLVCGEGNPAVLKLKSGSVAKGADGSGYLIGEITDVTNIDLTSWRYTIEVEDEEITEEETVTTDDLESLVGCLSLADQALLAKIGEQAETQLNWQTISLYGTASEVVTAASYLLRRHTGFRIHEFHIAIHSGVGPVSVSLSKTAANGTSYSTITGTATINGAGIYTARHAYASPVAIAAFEAIRANITGGADIYTATAFGLELHLLTSEL